MDKIHIYIYYILGNKRRIKRDILHRMVIYYF